MEAYGTACLAEKHGTTSQKTWTLVERVTSKIQE